MERFSKLKLFPGKYRVAGDQSSPPTDKILISIRIVGIIQQYFTPGNVVDYYTLSIERSERGVFELHRNTLFLSDTTTTISRILSSAGITTDYHPQIVPNIISQAQLMMIATPYHCENNIYDAPWLGVVVTIGTLIIPNDIAEGEEEMIRRATEESLMMMDIDTFKPGPASRYSIEALEKARFVQGLDYSSVLEAEEHCMICLEKLINYNSSSSSSSPAAVLKYEVEQVTRMPCLHMFHGDCIVRWLETSNMCPVCRFQMPTA